MMPTRADYEAATPKCPHAVGLSQGTVRACAEPMNWRRDDDSGWWWCWRHGRVLTGRDAAERLRDALGDAA